MVAIESYRPRAVAEEVARFARAAVAAAAPKSAGRAKSLLWAAVRLGAFGASVGLELCPEVLLHPSVIERFIVTGTSSASAPARRTLRTNLRHIAVRAAPQVQHLPAPVALPRERAKKGYSEDDIAAYLALADAQPSPARAMRASALVCLGAGAGLMGKDLRYVRGSDVICRSGGVVVEVKGSRPRAVPVLSRFHDRLLAAASFAKDGYVVGGKDPARRNLTYQLIASLDGGADLPPLDTGRLRATWLATLADDLGLATFMACAGITCSQRLGDIIATLAVADEKSAVRLLGAGR
jgi:integrase